MDFERQRGGWSALDTYMASLLSEAQYADIEATWTTAFDPTSRPDLRLKDES